MTSELREQCQPPANAPGDGRSPRSLRPLHCAIVILFCVLPAAISFAYIHAYGVNCVFEDSLGFPTLLEKYYQGQLHFQDFYEQDNEHRPFFPRLLMLPLALATRYNSIAEMYVSWAFICLSAIPVYLYCRQIYSDRLAALTAFVPAAWVLFSLGQSENLLMGWQLVFFMANAFLLYSMYFLQNAGGLDTRMAAAAVAGVLASFSFSCMLLIWPIGLMMIFIRKSPRESGKSRAAAMLFWSLTGICVWTAYFAGWHRISNHPSFSFGLRHPSMFVRYICNYVSSPWGPDKDGRVLLLLAYLGAAALTFRQWRTERTLPSMPIAMVLFVIGAAFATAIGRAGFGTTQALQPRYQTFSNVGLIGIYLLCLPLLSEIRCCIGKYDASRILGAFLFFLLAVRPMYVKPYPEGEKTLETRSVFAYALRTAHMQSDSYLKRLCPEPSFFRQVSDFLERWKLNVFAEPPAALPDQMRQVDEKGLPYCIEMFSGSPVQNGAQSFLFRKDMDTISVLGHAEDKLAKGPAGGVFIEVDGQLSIPSAYGLPRPQWAIDSGIPGYRYSGFECDFATTVLKPGRHELRVKVVSADRKSYAISSEFLVIIVP
jgi:hypothetical protein